jgi:hypothetical protein
MRQTHVVQLQKCLFDLAVDPCLTPVACAFGTFADHRTKIGIAGDMKTILPDGFG